VGLILGAERPEAEAIEGAAGAEFNALNPLL
jgi:hypothetical protein